MVQPNFRWDEDDMAPTTTEAAARAQLLRHFVRTLRALPAGSALARRHPDLPKAGLHGGITSAVDADDPDHLAFFDIAYWVIGATPQNSDRYFELVLDAWREKGWPTRTDRDTSPRAGYTRTTDGFGISVRQSVDGYLSVSGTTPLFGADSDKGRPLPPRIDHPSEG
ncbi:hypothetical protein [Actinomadura rugatobispora]|uniref:Uncharacterized protein n=1 Tax=Actinomadura rugatobispora TaxID=1994 RepID=A0ABW1A404_9ACTN|nr:hypothetical protein GCM10010200_111420 [Actinomadura rugatobispora]